MKLSDALLVVLGDSFVDVVLKFSEFMLEKCVRIVVILS